MQQNYEYEQKREIWSWGQVQKLFLEPTYVKNQLWFWKDSPIFLFFILPHFKSLSTFLGPSGLFFCPLELFFSQDQVQNTLSEPTNIDYQFWFWKYSPIFLFLIRPNLGPFLLFQGFFGLFLGWGHV